MAVDGRPYDVAFLLKGLLGLLAIAAFMFITNGAGFLVMFPLLLVAIMARKPELLFYILISTITLTMSNPMLVPKGIVFSFAQRALLLVLSGLVAVRLFGRHKSQHITPFFSLFAYLAYMVIPSATGWNPTISYLKLLLFTMVLIAYLGVANAVITAPQVDSRKIRSIFLIMACYFIFGSLILLPFPELGQLRWEQAQESLARGNLRPSLFMGVSIHSQALGPLVATLAVMLFVDLVFSIRKLDRFYITLLVCAPILIVRTSSRTAMGAFLVGFLFVLYRVIKARGLHVNWKSKIIGIVVTTSVVTAVLILAVPQVRARAIGFALKYNQSPNDSVNITLEEMTATRSVAWDRALQNFYRRPMIGNGFQVSEEFVGWNPELTTMTAPVEKGTWVTAVLEEGGTIGIVLFLFFVLSVFVSLARLRCYQGLIGFFMLILTNFGELTIFSMTALGGLLWGLCIIGIVLDAQRIRGDQLRRVTF